MKSLMLTVFTLLLVGTAQPCKAESGPPAFAETEVTGRGTTEDEAFKQAVVEAVRSVVGTLVTAENVVNNDEVIKDKVLTLSNGFVEKVLEQKKQKLTDGTYEVALKCVVRKGQLYGTLKEANVPTVKFDGVSMFADVLSQVDFKKNAVKNLQVAFGKFYAEFPSLYKFTASKPEVVKTDDITATIKIQYSGEIDFKRYYKELVPALCDVLGHAAAQKQPQTSDTPPNPAKGELAIQTGFAEWLIYKIDEDILAKIRPLGNQHGYRIFNHGKIIAIFMDSDGKPLHCVSSGTKIFFQQRAPVSGFSAEIATAKRESPAVTLASFQRSTATPFNETQAFKEEQDGFRRAASGNRNPSLTGNRTLSFNIGGNKPGAKRQGAGHSDPVYSPVIDVLVGDIPVKLLTSLATVKLYAGFPFQESGQVNDWYLPYMQEGWWLPASDKYINDGHGYPLQVNQVTGPLQKGHDGDFGNVLFLGANNGLKEQMNYTHEVSERPVRIGAPE